MFLVFILLRFLGSVEVSGFKGNDIICDAMREVCLSFLPVLLQFVFFLFFIWKDSSLYLKIFKNIRSFWYLVKASDRWIPVLCSYDPSLLNLSLVFSFISPPPLKRTARLFWRLSATFKNPACTHCIHKCINFTIQQAFV